MLPWQGVIWVHVAIQCHWPRRDFASYRKTRSLNYVCTPGKIRFTNMTQVSQDDGVCNNSNVGGCQSYFAWIMTGLKKPSQALVEKRQGSSCCSFQVSVFVRVGMVRVGMVRVGMVRVEGENKGCLSVAMGKVDHTDARILFSGLRYDSTTHLLLQKAREQ